MHHDERAHHSLNSITGQEPSPPAKPLRLWHYGVLLVPYIGLLCPWFYSSWNPDILGVPFFYAYQFLWIFLSAGLTGLVYRSITR